MRCADGCGEASSHRCHAPQSSGSLPARQRSTKGRSSNPQKSSSPICMAGTPNTPLAIASSVCRRSSPFVVSEAACATSASPSRTDLARAARHDRRFREVPAPHPYGLEESADQSASCSRRERQRRRAQREQRIERMVRGRVERDAEQRRLAQVVARHPADLRRHLGRAELAVRLEQPGEQHRHRLHHRAVRRRDARQLRPREVRVRRDVVEVEADHGHEAAPVGSSPPRGP